MNSAGAWYPLFAVGDTADITHFTFTVESGGQVGADDAGFTTDTNYIAPIDVVSVKVGKIPLTLTLTAKDSEGLTSSASHTIVPEEA